VSQKNGTDISHYSYNAHQPILVIFGRDSDKSITIDRQDPVSGVRVSTGSADTSVSRDGITNNHSLAYSLSNICDKNFQNRLMCVEVILCNISVVFLRHSVVLSKLIIFARSRNLFQKLLICRIFE